MDFSKIFSAEIEVIFQFPVYYCKTYQIFKCLLWITYYHGEIQLRQVHEGIFASGGSDGAIMFWHVGEDKESGVIENAHESIVWSLAWHPIGHILCSGSNDHTAKFWDVSITCEFFFVNQQCVFTYFI